MPKNGNPDSQAIPYRPPCRELSELIAQRKNSSARAGGDTSETLVRLVALRFTNLNVNQPTALISSKQGLLHNFPAWRGSPHVMHDLRCKQPDGISCRGEHPPFQRAAEHGQKRCFCISATSDLPRLRQFLVHGADARIEAATRCRETACLTGRHRLPATGVSRHVS